ncbi:hypothetical protein FG386_001828 [Cryptosporidium ryanae]|uniref:uncharacterized protein n=1 Tax=Cryptosporidium ryanae TaxID=515981 RepID=UPI003519F70D|nr:hypothetical protein FG386_001828 [Cryptosporidium ryanae]
MKSNVRISETGMEIIKFSKGIQVQARNNRGTRYLNYKLLIRKIRWVFEQEEKKNFVEAQRYDLIFKDILLRDMNRMDSMYNRDINYIRDLMCIISRDIWSMSMTSQSNVAYSNMKLSNRVDDTNNLSSMFISSLSSLINPDFELANERKFVDWLHNLLECCGKLAKLRSYIIWNSIAVIKVLKKRKNKISHNRFVKNPIDAYSLLNNHEFYRGLTLEYLNKNFRNLMVKVFKKDMFSEICQKCNKKTSEPIKSICNHILCWKCITSVKETLIIDDFKKIDDVSDSNNEDDNNNCKHNVNEGHPLIDDCSFDFYSFKSDNKEEDKKQPTLVGEKCENRMSFKKIRNKPFKNCPVCHMKWSRNPESLQVENKLIKLFIKEYENRSLLTGVLELDTIIQSSVNNVGFISSDEESDDDFSESNVSNSIASVNSECEVSDCNKEHKNNRFGGVFTNKAVLSPSNNNLDNSYNPLSRPQSSFSTISSNNSTDDTSSNKSNRSHSNLNFNKGNSNINFNRGYEFINDSINTQRTNQSNSNSIYDNRNNYSNKINSKQINFSNVNFNIRSRNNFNNEWGINNARRDLDLNKMYRSGSDFRCSNPNAYNYRLQGKHCNQRRNHHNHQCVTNYNKFSDQQEIWNRTANNLLFVGNIGVRKFERDNNYGGKTIGKNKSPFFHSNNSSNNGSNITLFRIQNQTNDNIWSNGYQNSTVNRNSAFVAERNNHRLGLNINYSHPLNLNVNSPDNLKGTLTQTPFNYQGHVSKDCVVGRDRLWELPFNTQEKHNNVGVVNFNNSYAEIHSGSNFGIFLNNQFLNEDLQDYNRVGSNNVFSEINSNFNEIESLDSKLLEMFEGLGA